jgi:hypothetical protein
MARFIPNPISGLSWRPYKTEDEIDGECESCLRQWLVLSPEHPIPLPITTDLPPHCQDGGACRKAGPLWWVSGDKRQPSTTA